MFFDYRNSLRENALSFRNILRTTSAFPTKSFRVRSYKCEKCAKKRKMLEEYENLVYFMIQQGGADRALS